MKKIIDILFFGTLFILTFLEFYFIFNGSHYQYDFILVVCLLSLFYFIKDKLKIHYFHYFSLCVLLIFHSLGGFDFYRLTFFGLEYDTYLHFFFGFLLSIFLFRTFLLVGKFKDKRIIGLILIFMVLGVSALHELVEYGGALFLGEGEGVLFLGAGDEGYWDSRNDMFSNLVGSLVGLLGYSLFRRKIFKG